MDLNKLNISKLTGPNWRSYVVQVQAAARILNCWDFIKGEALGTISKTYDFPIHQMHETTEQAAAITTWNKKNSQAIGLIQGSISQAYGQTFSIRAKPVQCEWSW